MDFVEKGFEWMTAEPLLAICQHGPAIWQTLSVLLNAKLGRLKQTPLVSQISKKSRLLKAYLFTKNPL